MTYPRRLLVPPDAPGIYHCVSRCVRRAFLCGQDTVTGRSFEHRRIWLEERILELGNLFAVAVHAYAVMSNHLHVVLEVDPHAPEDWDDEEVARRWLAVCNAGGDDRQPLESRVRHLAAQPERLAVLRERLGSLSWFMRFLKEPVARRANREDGCTGRFWEGRFKTQALLDDPAVLACMVYVDLNPLRAGVARRAEDGPHTSFRHRSHVGSAPGSALTPVAAGIDSGLSDVTFSAYGQLLEWTALELHGEPGRVAVEPAPDLVRRLRLRPRQWLVQVPATESRYWRAIGAADALLECAQRLGQRWLHGIGTARAFEKVPDTS